MAKDIDMQRLTKVENAVFEEMTKQVMASVQKSLIKIQDVDHRLIKTDNYISRYLPFNNFCQIIEACKVTQLKLSKDTELRERIDNFEKFKMTELYQPILSDDGRPPNMFQKTMMMVDRKQIDETINKEVRLKSKNLRIMQMGALAMVNKQQAMNFDVKKPEQEAMQPD